MPILSLRSFKDYSEPYLQGFEKNPENLFSFTFSLAFTFTGHVHFPLSFILLQSLHFGALTTVPSSSTHCFDRPHLWIPNLHNIFFMPVLSILSFQNAQ